MVISLTTLEFHLWESANILRGPVDAADFKTYIFPLLFFKRICDVWDEEYQEIVEETGDEQLTWFPESHRFQIPEDCHWNDVRTKASNVGAALQRAMREIEKANPDTLYGVFGDAQWSNKERLSDALLKDLIEHFSALPFGNKNVNSDLLGDAYEYLIKKFADATNKKAGEFYTPRSVVRLMIDMLDPKEAETIYDPACGTGGMLLAAVQHVKEMHGDVKRLWGKLYGQEKNLTTSSIARMNLFLHGIEGFQVVRGDTLRNPAFFEVDRLATFDCVIANPPFSLEKWGEDLWLNDPFGRNFAGLPPSGGEYRTLKLYGQERNLITSSIARMNLFLHGVEDFEIIRGDTLADPKHIEGDRLRQFDVILANPPYSIKQWNREAWTHDKWGRNFLGTPPQGRADYAFQQHILASLTVKGRCAVLWPHGVLFRNEEQAMRAKMIKQDWVEAVIGLGPNLFYNSPMESCIVICNRKKPATRKSKVIFIDAVNEVTRERAQSFLKPEHQQRILAAFKAFADEPGFAKVATLAEINVQAGNLSIPLYVKRLSAKVSTQGNGEAVTLRAAWDQWQTDGCAFWQQMDSLAETLDSLSDQP